ncbi:unnamed protein product [Rhizophagus irregularis]|nr:unnamed protein product [Rhizophagus irregularis]CAB4434589.1 unnamed protein product [Rhizophagus irregularis]
MLYLFVTVYENGISLVKSAVVGIKESENFKDLLKEALSNELFLEDKLVKVDLQCNDSSAWHLILNGLTENLRSMYVLQYLIVYQFPMSYLMKDLQHLIS